MGAGSPRLPVLCVQPKPAVMEYQTVLVGLIWYMSAKLPFTPALSWCCHNLSYFLAGSVQYGIPVLESASRYILAFKMH